MKIRVENLPCNSQYGNISVIGVQDRGAAKACCQYKLNHEENPTWPNIHNMHSLEDAHIDEWFNYDPEIHCATCIHEEKGGVSSLRNHWNLQIPNKIPLEHHKGKYAIQSLELAFDNTCNMMCRICNPGQSSKWSASPILPELRQNIFDSIYWPVPNNDTKSYRKNLKRVLSNTNLSFLRHVLLVGGEPLYTKALPWFINLLKEKRPNDWQIIRITCVTNGGLMPDPDLFRGFDIKFQISIDGIGDLQTASRLKIPWETIDKNIRAMNELYKISIHSTISILNVNKIAELMLYCDNLNIPHCMAMLHDPIYYRLDNVPEEHRIRWLKTFQPMHTHAQHWQDRWHWVKLGMSYLEMPYQENPKAVKEFLAAIKITDKESTIPFADTNPEIMYIMEGLYKQFKDRGEYSNEDALSIYFENIS